METKPSVLWCCSEFLLEHQACLLNCSCSPIKNISQLPTTLILQCPDTIRSVSRTLFCYQNQGSTAREFSRKCEMPRCENSTLAIICPLLLINGIDVTILWAGLAKRSKEISCSRNLAAARDFYNARRTFYASGYKNLVEKSARRLSLVTACKM